MKEAYLVIVPADNRKKNRVIFGHSFHKEKQGQKLQKELQYALQKELRKGFKQVNIKEVKGKDLLFSRRNRITKHASSFKDPRGFGEFIITRTIDSNNSNNTRFSILHRDKKGKEIQLNANWSKYEKEYNVAGISIPKSIAFWGHYLIALSDYCGHPTPFIFKMQSPVNLK